MRAVALDFKDCDAQIERPANSFIGSCRSRSGKIVAGSCTASPAPKGYATRFRGC
jgi:hypothetical protein